MQPHATSCHWLSCSPSKIESSATSCDPVALKKRQKDQTRLDFETLGVQEAQTCDIPVINRYLSCDVPVVWLSHYSESHDVWSLSPPRYRINYSCRQSPLWQCWCTAPNKSLGCHAICDHNNGSWSHHLILSWSSLFIYLIFTLSQYKCKDSIQNEMFWCHYIHQENEEEKIIHYNHSMQWIMLDMVRYVQVID